MVLRLVRKKSLESSLLTANSGLEEKIRSDESSKIVGIVSLPFQRKDFCYLWDGERWYFLHLDNFFGPYEYLDNGDFLVFNARPDRKGRYPIAYNAEFYVGLIPVIPQPPLLQSVSYSNNLGVKDSDRPSYGGNVIFFNDKRGFGFIEPDTEGKKATSGKDVMAPFRAIDMPGYKTLIQNQKVEFQFIERPRGPYATYIKPL